MQNFTTNSCTIWLTDRYRQCTHKGYNNVVIALFTYLSIEPLHAKVYRKCRTNKKCRTNSITQQQLLLLVLLFHQYCLVDRNRTHMLCCAHVRSWSSSDIPILLCHVCMQKCDMQKFAWSAERILTQQSLWLICCCIERNRTDMHKRVDLKLVHFTSVQPYLQKFTRNAQWILTLLPLLML